MITPSDIVNHLAKYLPRVTDFFNVTIGIDTAIISGGYTVTVETIAAHGLSVGASIILNEGQTPNTISSIVEETEDTTALITFYNVHDFTTPNTAISTEPLPVVGFNESEWNVTLDIIDVPTDQSVVVNFPSGATGIPTFTPGSAIGYENRPVGILGLQSVATVPTTTSFTVLLDSSEVPPLPAGDIINLEATTAVRVAAADNIDRADAIYAKQTDTDDLWAFVIMNDTDVSKDRNTYSDATAKNTDQNPMRLTTLVNFSVVVFFRSAESISGATAQELAYGEIYKSILSVLYGYSGFASDEDGSVYATNLNGHGAGGSTVAYYTHVYDFELPIDITVDNGFPFYEDVAFRDISATFGIFTADNEEQLTLAIKLDT